MEFAKTLMISASGMRAQGQRMRIISENLANANSLPQSPNDEPYRRKLPTFKNVLDRTAGVEKVSVGRIELDKSAFGKRYDPSHPGADAAGYVQLPNVNSLIEMMDMREAQRSYEANLNIITSVRQMMKRTVDILRG